MVVLNMVPQLLSVAEVPSWDNPYCWLVADQGKKADIKGAVSRNLGSVPLTVFQNRNTWNETVL